MTAQLINFPGGPVHAVGNGAREAAIEIGEALPNTSADDAARWADWLLAEFWARGFKVARLNDH